MECDGVVVNDASNLDVIDVREAASTAEAARLLQRPQEEEEDDDNAYADAAPDTVTLLDFPDFQAARRRERLARVQAARPQGPRAPGAYFGDAAGQVPELGEGHGRGRGAGLVAHDVLGAGE